MDFTLSRDGVRRATLRITHRVDVSQVITALALHIVGNPERAAEMSLREVVVLLRERLEMDGRGEHWTEFGEDDELYAAAVEAATRRIAELFPGVS